MAWAYFGILFVTILFWFLIVKRSMVEGMWIAFIILLTISGMWGNAFGYVLKSSKNSILLTIGLFMFFSKILEKTGVLEDCLDILVAIVGRFAAGSGYVAVIASAFMGTLSGSVPGNVAATGCITIPAMKRSGYTPELAAGICVAGSSLGCVVPPSTLIILSFGFLNEMFPDTYIFSDFWTFMYYIAAIYIAHRLITVFILCKAYKIQPMDKADLPDLKTAFKRGWASLLLPLVVFLPFWINNTFNATFVTDRLGKGGASSFSSSLLIIAPCIAILYTMLVAKDKKTVTPSFFVESMRSSIKGFAPLMFMVVGGYSIGELFTQVGVMDMMLRDLQSINIPFWAVATIMPLVLGAMGCFFDGLSILTLLGPLVLTVSVSVGISPWLSAAMMPGVIHSMCHMTPPYAPGLLMAIGMAEADFKETCKQMFVWIGGHYAITVLLYFGIIPIIGSIR